MKNILIGLFTLSIFSCANKREKMITKEKEIPMNDSISLKTIEIANKKGYKDDILAISYPHTKFSFINENENKIAQDFLKKAIDESEELTQVFSNINATQKVEIIKNDNGILGFWIQQFLNGEHYYDTHYYNVREKKQLLASDVFFPKKRFEKLAEYLSSKYSDLDVDFTPINENYKAFTFDEVGNLSFAFKDIPAIQLKREEIAQFINPKLRYAFNVPPEIDCGKVPCVALTFDDGPSKLTSGLLDILKENDAKATFYVLGNMVNSNPDILKRVDNEGHQIGNHTWNHKNLATLKKEGIEYQLTETNKKINEVVGHFPTTLRPPYGSFNASVATIADMPIILWSVDTNDWKHRNPSRIISEMEKAKNGDIILAHDIHKTTIEAMPIAIKKLKDKGFHFVTLDDLFYGKKLENGKTYNKR